MDVSIERMQRRSSLLAIYWILFLDHFSFAIAFPLFPMLLLRPELGFLTKITDEGARGVILYVLLAALPFAQCFGAPFFGEISDRLGRKKTLLWTIGGSLLGNLLTTFSIYTESFTLLIFSRIVTGFFSANLALTLAAIVDFDGEGKERSFKLSFAAACVGLAWIAAIGLGGVLPRFIQTPASYPLMIFGVTAALLLLSLWVLVQFFRDAMVTEQRRPFQLLKGFHNTIRLLESKKMCRLYGVLFLWFVGFTIALFWSGPISLKKFKMLFSQVDWMFLIFAAAWVVSSSWINTFLIPRYSLWKSTLWCLVVLMLSYFIAGASDYFFYFALLFCGSGVFTAIIWADTVSLISLSASENDQGKAMGLAQSTLSFAEVCGMILGGLIASGSADGIFYFSALMALAAFCLLLSTYWSKARKNGS